MNPHHLLSIKKFIYFLLGALCLTPWVSPPIALLTGIIFSFILGNPFPKTNGKITKYLLQFCVIGLGLGMNFYDALKIGREGLVFTAFSIFITLFFGLFLTKLFKINKKIGILVSSGTAICGGSAIAAVSPIIDSDEHETSISLATVFILNSVALFLFPVIGHLLNLSQEQFGFWAAIAIHDTSSVVGAAQHYGAKALEIATMVKLERALWIIPLSVIIIIISSKKNEAKNKTRKMTIPYFIFGFIIAVIFNTFVPKYIPAFHNIDNLIVILSKKGLTLTLYLIGCGLSLSSIKLVGIRPLLQGFFLWVFISVLSLSVILLTIH